MEKEEDEVKASDRSFNLQIQAQSQTAPSCPHRKGVALLKSSLVYPTVKHTDDKIFLV